jgi:hypothetical protein
LWGADDIAKTTAEGAEKIGDTIPIPGTIRNLEFSVIASKGMSCVTFVPKKMGGSAGVARPALTTPPQESSLVKPRR